MTVGQIGSVNSAYTLKALGAGGSFGQERLVKVAPRELSLEDEVYLLEERGRLTKATLTGFMRLPDGAGSLSFRAQKEPYERKMFFANDSFPLEIFAQKSFRRKPFDRALLEKPLSTYSVVKDTSLEHIAPCSLAMDEVVYLKSTGAYRPVRVSRLEIKEGKEWEVSLTLEEGELCVLRVLSFKNPREKSVLLGRLLDHHTKAECVEKSQLLKPKINLAADISYHKAKEAFNKALGIAREGFCDIKMVQETLEALENGITYVGFEHILSMRGFGFEKIAQAIYPYAQKADFGESKEDVVKKDAWNDIVGLGQECGIFLKS